LPRELFRHAGLRSFIHRIEYLNGHIWMTRYCQKRGAYLA
jgi:hypothetical protein